MDLEAAVKNYVFSLIMLNKIPMTQERLAWLQSRTESAFNYELREGYRVVITPELATNSIRVEVLK